MGIESPPASVAALYDVHGNLPALEAVLEEIRDAGAGAIVVGGDLVPGPMPRETIALLLELEIPTRFIRGNGEVAVLAARAGRDPGRMPEPAREAVEWTARQLRPDEERVLAGWPGTVTLRTAGIGDVLFCHATPRNENEIFTRLTAEERVAPAFDGVTAPLVVCGHTHMQFDRTIGAVRVVNAGSVGMPFGQPGAYWLLLGRDVQFRRTPYDRANAARRIRGTSYPQAEHFATHGILQPPSESQMLELFASSELR
ncbi:MAG TPA: metallophosphoesterase family protein [Vicinamibacterales bacterium]|nr:metallophosphoesterase family protein [Vicinamibacterales bacterium]